MKRRSFIRSTAGAAVSLPFIIPGMKMAALPDAGLFGRVRRDQTDRILVIIQLNGGNDGLNMLVPRDQYANLLQARPEVALPENQILDLTTETGLHPAMAGIRNLFQNGRAAFVQSVGYPNQNRSHFRSMDIWTSASPADAYWGTGWVGRYLDTRFSGYPEGYPSAEHPDPFAISIGNTVSETCQGVATNYSLALQDPFQLTQLFEDEEEAVPDSRYGRELSYLRTTVAQSNAYAESILEAANMGNNLADYPRQNLLARQLETVALLISGGLQTRIYIVSLGGFDTHANQVDRSDPTEGRHGELLLELSEAIAAFDSDMDQLGYGDRVLGMTFSEFGRQIRSNNSLGTDHGTAAPLILFGGCTQGDIIGHNPTIPGDVALQDGVPMQFDFRDVYGSVLMDWFGVEEQELRAILHPDFQYLPVLAGCQTDPARLNNRQGIRLESAVEASAFPNPFAEWTTIAYQHPGGQVKISILDSLRREIRVLSSQNLGPGKYQFPFEGRGLAPGNYYFRIAQEGGVQQTFHLVKQ